MGNVGSVELPVFNCVKRLRKMSPTVEAGQKFRAICPSRCKEGVLVPIEVKFTAINTNTACLCEDEKCSNYLTPAHAF